MSDSEHSQELRMLGIQGLLSERAVSLGTVHNMMATHNDLTSSSNAYSILSDSVAVMFNID